MAFMAADLGTVRQWLLLAAAGASGLLAGSAAGYAASRVRGLGLPPAAVRIEGPGGSPFEQLPVPHARGRAGLVARAELAASAGSPAARLRELDAIVARASQSPSGRASGGPGVPPPDEPERLFALVERARLFLEEAWSPTLAFADLDAVLLRPSGDFAAEALRLRARARAEAGSLGGALEDAMRFLDLFPRSARAVDAALLACDILESTSRLTEAIALAEDTLARDPARADRARLDPGERGRYPARAERLCLRLGRLYLRAGELASAEAAFDLVASPPVGGDDFGETWRESPLLAEALLGRGEAVLRMRDARLVRTREELAAWRARWNLGTPERRRAEALLGEGPALPAERALEKAERGDLSGASRELASARVEVARSALQELARSALERAWLDPVGSLELGAALSAAGASGDAAELAAIARSRALEAQGRLAGAIAELESNGGVRACLALADLARRCGDRDLVREALGRAATRSELARELMAREDER